MRATSAVVAGRARAIAAVWAAKLTSTATRSLGRGGGSALPGLVATRVQPSLVRDLSAQLGRGSALVSGTNGKTTTSRMLAGILAGAGYGVLRNATGSNLTRGVASALVAGADLLGRMSKGEPTFGLFEVDEAALPEVAGLVRPSTLLLLNLFRDQLDRYGEVATVARLWSSAVASLPGNATVVANADDPLVAEVAARHAGRAVYFGLESVPSPLAASEHAGDVKTCPRCGGPIAYTLVSLGHMGHYACARCEFRRPAPAVWATDVELLGVSGSRFTLHADGDSATVQLPLPGLYNIYNAAAAAATAVSLGVDLTAAADSLRQVTPAFGRMERLEIDGKSVYLALAKNPAGLNEIMRTVTAGAERPNLLIMLNDNTADGHDVSWIWDADVEMLADRVGSVVFSGTRAEDMALRFKYAGVIPEDTGGDDVVSDTRTALERALERVEIGDTLFVVPTYTAMLDVRAVLTALGRLKPYWEE